MLQRMGSNGFPALLEQRVQRTLWGVLVLAVGYSVWRAWTLRIEYFDGYAWLTNVWQMLLRTADGYEPMRPPGIDLITMSWNWSTS